MIDLVLVTDEPVPDAVLGPRLAAGRDTVVYELGPDRVLRRATRDRSYVAEAQVMDHVRAAGYPVPAVHRVGPGEMVLERITGPTMLEDLLRRPWRVDRHARLLADLHRRLHEIRGLPGMKPFAAPGDAVLHLDLHPANVLLSPSGPVVIDWTNAAVGAPGADVALTWIVLRAFESDASLAVRIQISVVRRRLARVFVDHAGRREAVAALRAVADHRAVDRNIRPTELRRMERLVSREVR
jgi:tRNA A-37 threonylcarbamoyl transferase component Bud32